MPPLTLNPDLDLDALAAAYAADRKLRIPNVLTPESAEALASCLESATPFSIATLSSEGRPLVIPGPQISWRAPVIQAALERAQERFSFIYKSFPMLTAYQRGEHPGHFLHDVFEFLNSPAFIGLVRTVTGHDDVVRADAQATRYEPGCFLTTHNDFQAGHRRRAAYVLGLTRRWRLDWGGLLIFFDEKGHITSGDTPGFNTLDLFSTPRLHAVTQVAPYARVPRHTITGWARAGETALD
ncbi:MAG: 2OG-Fe(II) oxygenase family protein [Hyphomonas sp.]|nr:2OG-Fe(II) oxygenase family protein [Hyphomonas sp.]